MTIAMTAWLLLAVLEMREHHTPPIWAEAAESINFTAPQARSMMGEVSPTIELSVADREYLARITIRRGRIYGWMPFGFTNSDGVGVPDGDGHIGITEDYWQLIRGKIGLKETIAGPMSSTEILQAYAAGAIDLYPSATYTTDLSNYGLFSAAYERYPIAIATRKDTGFISDVATLAGHTVAVGQAFGTYNLLKIRYPGIKFLQVTDTRDAIRQVAFGYAKAAIDVLPVLQYQIQQCTLSDIKLAGVSTIEFPLQVMLRREYAPLLPLINRAIAAITPTERLTIHKKWMLRGVITEPDRTWLWQILLIAFLLIITMYYRNRRMILEISYRKHVEAQLRVLLRAVEQTHSTIVITNAKAIIEFANPSLFRTTGYTVNEAQGQTPQIFKSGKHHKIFYEQMWATIRAGKVWRGELCNKRKDGSLYWEFMSISPIKDDSGKITHYVAVKEDVDERKHTEIALQKSQEQYQRLVDDIGPNFVVYSHRSDGVLEYVSKGVNSIFGITPDAAIGKAFADLIPWHPSSLERSSIATLHMLTTGTGVSPWEMQFGRPDGTVGTILVTSHPVVDDNGLCIRIEGIMEDITERKRAEEYIHTSEEKLRGLYELSPLGIALTDINGHYLDFNDAFINICGYSAAELKNLDYWTLTPQEYAEQEAVQLQSLSQHGRYGPYEKEYQRKDGTRIPLRLNGVLVDGQDGQSFVWSLVEDITAQKQHEAELRQAKEAAEAANRAKSAFLANMSHELRTPLNAVLGYAQILQQDKSLPEAKRHDINIIKRSGEYLLTLINDVLDLAKVEAGHLELFPRNFGLKHFFADLSDLFRIRAAEKNLELHYQAAFDLPAEVNADEKRLRQVCMNLLSNAIKFTEQGAVSLHVDYQNGNLIISVTDSGIGIPQDMQERIFKPFVQTGEDRYKQQGTGLGLAISRNLIERMGGQIALQSTEGRGSCFRVSIPAMASGSVKQVAEQHIEENGGAWGVPTSSMAVMGLRRTDGQSLPFQILVVDDIAENRTVLRGLLEPLGFVITEANDGDEAVALATERGFDVIFMDLVMTNMNGLTATRHILGRAGRHNRIIIAITASVFVEDRMASLSAGCVDYLVKPVEQAVLLQALHKHLPLEWIYADSPKAVTLTPSAPLTLAQRETIMDMVERGDVHNLIGYLEQLLSTADCPEQGRTLLTLAKGFKLAEIRRRLEL